jgi:hypothetical protein
MLSTGAYTFDIGLRFGFGVRARDKGQRFRDSGKESKNKVEGYGLGSRVKSQGLRIKD